MTDISRRALELKKDIGRLVARVEALHFPQPPFVNVERR